MWVRLNPGTHRPILSDASVVVVGLFVGLGGGATKLPPPDSGVAPKGHCFRGRVWVAPKGLWEGCKGLILMPAIARVAVCGLLQACFPPFRELN